MTYMFFRSAARFLFLGNMVSAASVKLSATPQKEDTNTTFRCIFSILSRESQ